MATGLSLAPAPALALTSITTGIMPLLNSLSSVTGAPLAKTFGLGPATTSGPLIDSGAMSAVNTGALLAITSGARSTMTPGTPLVN
ncbi:hypothetical protein PGT21_035954 [Puccinia graminis f. sp. tritici]|uniref:Uncharacterized protein n=1 Tax=Puccinia graminis f. sp. tritici TaxID=56615 RepID=A0A5B0NQV7_PUCGR|nr:hypothetical protein PGT21_035954 [Puccinia graminis f. sp. tritici]